MATTVSKDDPGSPIHTTGGPDRFDYGLGLSHTLFAVTHCNERAMVKANGVAHQL
jgi:hypothetical protein